jgi:hypothetical protein
MADVLFIITIAIILTIISIGLAMVVWTSSRRDFRKPFAVLMFSQMLIVWAYLLDITSPTLEGKLFWNNAEYFGYLLGIGSFILFVLQYTRNVRLDAKLGLLLGAPSIFFMAAVATNPWHHLFYTGVVISDSFYRSFVPTYGPIFWAFVVYNSAIMLAGMAILGIHFFRVSNAHRRNVGITFFASILNAATILVNFIMVETVPGGVLLGIGFLASNLMMFVGAFGFELFAVVPFGLDRVIDITRSIIFILDDKDVIMYQNPAATILVDDAGREGERHLTDAIPNFPHRLLGGNKNDPREEDVHELLPGRFFDVTVTLIYDHSGNVMGKTVMLREMTAQRAAEAEARTANYKLDLMNSITRHDVMNQLTVLQGNLMLAGSKSDPSAVHAHIAASYQAALNIQKQMDFAREYQEIENRVPVWQDVGEKIRALSKIIDLRGAKLEVNVQGIEVLADPLLEKVLYNLIDNSLVHGGGVSRMSFSARETEGGMELTYADDGVGVPGHMKAGLFTKGFGNHTGLGLYLSREILSHSEMVITEEGRPGRGARFVIRIPPGRFRATHNNDTIMAAHLPSDHSVRAE